MLRDSIQQIEHSNLPRNHFRGLLAKLVFILVWQCAVFRQLPLFVFFVCTKPFTPKDKSYLVNQFRWRRCNSERVVESDAPSYYLLSLVGKGNFEEAPDRSREPILRYMYCFAFTFDVSGLEYYIGKNTAKPALEGFWDSKGMGINFRVQ